MIVIDDINEIKNYKIVQSAVTIGKFDGVHRGHMLLLNRILELKNEGYTAVVCMINQGKPGVLSFREKAEYLESLGVDYLINFRFTDEFAKQTPEQFISSFLMDKLDAAKVVVGNDFHFGYKRSGDTTTLKSFEKKYGYTCDFYEKLKEGSTVISSTEIRQSLGFGDMASAKVMLGRPYSICGTVVHGKHLGSTIGFPTINILPEEDKLVPKYGVYTSKVLVGSEEYRGITNIGEKPTVGGFPVSAETYIFDFDRDIYGEQVTVIPERFIREERRFASIDELKAQLDRDIEDARNI